MSLSIRPSIIEQFNFEGKNVRSFYVKGIGGCLVASDVCAAIGYSDERSGRRAIQRHVPEKYQVRYKHVKTELNRRYQVNPPQDDQILLKEAGLNCFLLRCKMEKADPFMEWVCEEVVPREIRKLNAELEEKNFHLALLNDNLAESQDLVRQLEFNNTGLQGEIRAKDQEIERRTEENADLIANRHVPRRNGIDNVLVVIEKNESNEEGKEGMFPYYISHLAILMSNLRKKYPLMEVKEPQIEDANAIHRWNRFKEDYLQKDDYFRNHFTLLNGDAIEQFEKVFGIDMT